jgi:tetratricopeptide (TPR) repeat protein
MSHVSLQRPEEVPTRQNMSVMFSINASAANDSNSLLNPLPSQPIAPEIFFGRDDIVSDLASLIVQNDQTRLAILGTAGIGKTATALHILHHPDIVTRYEDRRYFVGCDTVTSAESLAALILQIVRAPSVAGENIVTVLHRVLLAAPFTLLLLDNFETVWDTISGRDGVLDLLQKIGNAKPVSLMITMRGAVPPLGIVWTRFESLPPLSPPAAKSLFLAINPSLNNRESKHEEYLDTLLAEMDHVPLAVRLLAQVSIGFSPLYMLKRWREETTAMLCTHETMPGKLESIEVSISLSLSALDITSNPEAVQLLGILCQLPDGLHHWEERLQLIGAGLRNIHRLVHLLHKTALIFIAGSGLKVLSPIRHFINHHRQADLDHVQSLENYFWEIVHTYSTEPVGPGFPHAREIMEPDLGNIRSLIKNAVQTHPSAHLVEIAIEVSEFLRLTIPSTEILYDVMPLVKQIGLPIQEARIFQSLGDILYRQSKYTEASETLAEARRQFLEVGDILGAARCSQSFGHILYMQDKYTDASETLIEARTKFLEIGNVLGVARCSLSLGDILRMQNKFTEASETLTEARRQFLKIGDVLGATECSQSLGDVLYMRDKPTEAHKTLTEARQQFLEIGNVVGAAQCSQSLGNILHILAKYAEASNLVTEARNQFLEIGAGLSVAQCSQSLGEILYVQTRYTEASATLADARKQFLDIGDVLGAAQCSRNLGEILCMQANYTEASETLTDAQRQFLNIGDVLGAAQCSRNLGDVLRMQAKYTEASETLTEARRQFLEIGSVFGEAQCSQSLGEILRMQAKYAEASETLTKARRQFLEIGFVHGMVKCSQSLGDILRMQSKYSEASETLTDTRRQFLEIGLVLDAAECSRILDDMQAQLTKPFDTVEAEK